MIKSGLQWNVQKSGERTYTHRITHNLIPRQVCWPVSAHLCPLRHCPHAPTVPRKNHLKNSDKHAQLQRVTWEGVGERHSELPPLTMYTPSKKVNREAWQEGDLGELQQGTRQGCAVTALTTCKIPAAKPKRHLLHFGAQTWSTISRWPVDQGPVCNLMLPSPLLLLSQSAFPCTRCLYD